MKTNFTAALPNNVLYFISYLSLTSLKTYRLLSTSECKGKKVSLKDIHRGSILLHGYIHETAQQGILRLLTKEFYWKVKTDLHFWQPPRGVTANTQPQLCIYQLLLLWESLSHHVIKYDIIFLYYKIGGHQVKMSSTCPDFTSLLPLTRAQIRTWSKLDFVRLSMPL